jgi:hypothetical protein
MLKADLGGNTADELLHVKLGWARLLARCIGTFQAAVGLSQSTSLTA